MSARYPRCGFSPRQTRTYGRRRRSSHGDRRRRSKTRPTASPVSVSWPQLAVPERLPASPSASQPPVAMLIMAQRIAVSDLRRRLDPLLFASTYLGFGFICVYEQGALGGVRDAGAVGPASPSGHYVEAPAAALLPALARREFPKSRPLGGAHADFSDTLHCSGSALLAMLRAGSTRSASGGFPSV